MVEIVDMTPPRTIREMMEHSAALKCCPICAGAYWYTKYGPVRAFPRIEQLAEDVGGGWRVICYHCMVSISGLTKAEAIALWNHRPQIIAAVADLE